jgi:hypothetical protein
MLWRAGGREDVNAAMRLKGKTVHIHRQDANLPEAAIFCRTCWAPGW